MADFLNAEKYGIFSLDLTKKTKAKTSNIDVPF